MTHSGPIIASRETKKVNGDSHLANVIDCEVCRYPHLDPLPTMDELGEFYAYHFYEKQKPDYLEKMAREENYWLNIYKVRMELFLEQIPTKSPRILDVGSSGGAFLKSAQDLGAKVYGIEPSSKAAQHCQDRYGISDVQVCLYENADFQDEYFDLIHSSFVMEHMRDPRHFVEWAYSKLKPGGFFVCETPNEFNAFQNIATKHLGHNDWFVAYPDHLNYFNEQSLRQFIESEKFEFVSSFASYPIEQFILGGFDYIKNPDLGRTAHSSRMEFELNLINSGQKELLKNFYKFWATQKVGRSITCLFRKQ